MNIDFATPLAGISADRLRADMEAYGIDYVVATDQGTADPGFALANEGYPVIPGVSLLTDDRCIVYVVGAVDLVCLPYGAPFNQLYELVWHNGGAIMIDPQSLPFCWERADASFTYIEGRAEDPKCVSLVAGTGRDYSHFGKAWTNCKIDNVKDLVEALRLQPELFTPELR